MRSEDEIESLELEIENMPEEVAANFLGKSDWKERLRRSLLYPGTQDIDDVLPLPVSEFCVEKYREYAPSKLKKLGPRVASRLSRNACLSPSAVITSLIYLQRLKESNPDYLKKVPSSDLFIVSMMVASKYLFDDGTDDECYNDEWAECMGIDLTELGVLELDFLAALDWRCHVDRDQFISVLHNFEVQLALAQSAKTGMFTYNTARNIDIMVSMTETVKIVSKLFFLSAVTLFSFTSILNNVGQKLSQPEPARDLDRDNWNVTSYPEATRPISESDQISDDSSSSIEEMEQLRKLIDEQNSTAKNIHRENSANDTSVVEQNPITAAISKITSPHCGSFLCIPHAPNDMAIRPKIAVII